MIVEFEQEIFLWFEEERFFLDVWVNIFKNQMRFVFCIFQGLDDSLNFVINGIKNQGFLWFSFSGQWLDGGGKYVNNREF